MKLTSKPKPKTKVVAKPKPKSQKSTNKKLSLSKTLVIIALALVGVVVVVTAGLFIKDRYFKPTVTYGNTSKQLQADIKLLNKQISESPLPAQKAELYNQLANRQIVQGNYDDAVATLNNAINEQPKAASYGSLAYIYEIKGDYQQALDNYTKALNMAIDVDSTNPNSDYNIFTGKVATVKERLGQ